MQRLEENWYAVDGTPTDCVNLAVLWLLKETPPDLVVSGINFGLNVGDDVTYSGTVSATFEGSLLGIPSIAFSQEVGEHFSFERGRPLARSLVDPAREGDLPRTCCSTSTFRRASPGAPSPSSASASTASRWSRRPIRAATSTSGSPAPRSGRTTRAPITRRCSSGYDLGHAAAPRPHRLPRAGELRRAGIALVNALTDELEDDEEGVAE
jgi:hypothetical protein